MNQRVLRELAYPRPAGIPAVPRSFLAQLYRFDPWMWVEWRFYEQPEPGGAREPIGRWVLKRRPPPFDYVATVRVLETSDGHYVPPSGFIIDWLYENDLGEMKRDKHRWRFNQARSEKLLRDHMQRRRDQQMDFFDYYARGLHRAASGEELPTDWREAAWGVKKKGSPVWEQ